MQKLKKSLWQAAWVSSSLVMVALFFSPVIWMLLCSFRPDSEIFSFPPRLLPRNWTLDAYRSIFSDRNFLVAIINTISVSLFTTIFSLFIAAPAAYAMTRFRFRSKGLLRFYILTTQMLPVIMLAIPFFAVYSKIGLLNNRLGLIIAYTSFSLPFCSMTLVSFFGSIPASLDEAARIDGCSSWGAFSRVILPIAQPALVSTGLFAFVTAWNEYLMASVLTSKPRAQMLVVLIGSKMGQHGTSWAELLAITTIASIPLIIIYATMQKSFIRGMTAGAVKM
ncbi:MAG: carbohydrate ABC transporter permease [Spirochaetota bacterium]